MNEPNTFAINSYATGTYAPGRCSEWEFHNCLGGNSATEPYIVGHNLILAHARAVKIYREKYQVIDSLSPTSTTYIIQLLANEVICI